MIDEIATKVKNDDVHELDEATAELSILGESTTSKIFTTYTGPWQEGGQKGSSLPYPCKCKNKKLILVLREFSTGFKC